ncbi:MAG: hypothetical protein U0235_29610 [Polyangiaceae bacterium]
MNRSRLLGLTSLAFLALTAACSASSDASDESNDNLFSITGEPRKLKFTSYVYVSANASDQEIYSAIKRMNQSAFGALRTANIGVNTRELAPGGGLPDPIAYVKDAARTRREPVKVIDPANPSAPPKDMLRVRYTYEDDAIVPETVPQEQKMRSAVTAAVLNGNYQMQSERVLTECTENGTHDREFSSSVWYVFNPSLSSCKTAMKTEQQKIDADRAQLTDKKTQVPLSEVNRLYVPVRVALKSTTEGTGQERPEYDRLYKGGVKSGRLVIGMVNGKMADWAAGEQKESIDDDGYGMYFEGLQEIFKARNFKFVATDPPEDFSKMTVNGQTVNVPGGFMDVFKWETASSGFPTGVDKRALRVAAGKKIAKHWVKFEAPVKVKIGAEPEKDVVIELNTYVEAEGGDGPHRKALKESDIFVYNGHSYIGYGPLDPSRYHAGDLPQSYQLFFINGCVSYNYYEKDYISLKNNKTKDLDLITNGLESWVNGSGPAMGRFVAKIIDGTQADYEEILKAAQFEENWGHAYDWGDDALRVIDGELDNQYNATTTPIAVRQ